MDALRLEALDALEAGERGLVEAARAAAEGAYVPYSGFAVGAAVRMEDGSLQAGANVENASYGLAVCAERVALWTAVAAGARRLGAVAVWTGSGPPAPPCGACLQVLEEFRPAGGGLRILLAGPSGVRRTTLASLLPEAFGAAHLPPRGGAR